MGRLPPRGTFREVFSHLGSDSPTPAYIGTDQAGQGLLDKASPPITYRRKLKFDRAFTMGSIINTTKVKRV